MNFGRPLKRMGWLLEHWSVNLHFILSSIAVLYFHMSMYDMSIGRPMLCFMFYHMAPQNTANSFISMGNSSNVKCALSRQWTSDCVVAIFECL